MGFVLGRLLRAALTQPQNQQIASPFANSDALTRVTLESLFPGADPEAWPVTQRQAMRVPAVAAAHHRVVGTLSRLPIRAVVTSTGARWAGYTGLLDQPDPAEPRSTTLRKTLEDIMFHGGAYWAVTGVYRTGEDGSPLAVRPQNVVQVPRCDVEVDPDTGRLTIDPRTLRWIASTRGVQVLQHPTAPEQPWLIAFDGPHDGLCEIGAVAVRSAMRLDKAAQHAADNPVPSIELHQTTDAELSDTEIDDLTAQWVRARRTHGVGYTNAAIELRTHGQQPEQLLIDGRNQQAVEIARTVGIPAASIDAGIPGTSLTYANLQDRLSDLINFGLQLYAASIVDRLSMADCLPRGINAKWDYDELAPIDAGSATPTDRTPTPTRVGATK